MPAPPALLLSSGCDRIARCSSRCRIGRQATESNAWTGRPRGAPQRAGSLAAAMARGHKRREGRTAQARVGVAKPLRRPAFAPIGATGPPREPTLSSHFRCARVDSNHHGEISPQGPQPRTRTQDASRSVQIVQVARLRGHIGRICSSERCHDVATARCRTGLTRIAGSFGITRCLLGRLRALHGPLRPLRPRAVRCRQRRLPIAARCRPGP